MRLIMSSCLLIGLLSVAALVLGCADKDKGKVINKEKPNVVLVEADKDNTRDNDNTKERTRGAAKTTGTKRALLVGCTKYEFLEERHWLKGPGNDVILMQDLLVTHFGFSKENIVILSEAAGAKDKNYLPQYKNIKREYAALAKAAGEGDQVVIMMGGHGSQVPEDPRSKEPEPDGLDEIFLPSDTKKWGGDGDHARPENVIVDDELGEWVKAIQSKKANVWLIIDACHSGTMIRGNERTRDLKPGDLGITREQVDKAIATAAKRPVQPGKEQARGGVAEAQPMKLARAGGIVALYAAQAKEVTVERDLPDNAKDAKSYGLLSFTIAQTLIKAKAAGTPISYRELIHRIQRQYDAWNRTYPTPVIEGDDQYREVLGDREFKKEFRLALEKTDDGWKINAGGLQGMTKGSILAVYPPDGKQDKPAGHVRIENVRTLEADVAPCKYNDVPRNKDLPKGGICKVVYSDAGDQAVKLAFDPDPRSIALQKQKGTWTINAGTVQGLLEGNILAVYPAEGKQDKAVGHVRVKKARLVEADVTPCEYQKMAAVDDLPKGGVCKVVQADKKADPGIRKKFVATIQEVLEKTAGKGNIFKASDSLKEADWHLTVDGGRFLLVPSTGFSAQYNSKESKSFRGPKVDDDEELEDWLVKESLNRIGRATNLIKLAASMSSETSRGEYALVNVKVELFLATEVEKDGKIVKKVLKKEPIKITPGYRFHDGDVVVMRITNMGLTDADVTVLYVDSDYGITPLWPVKTGNDNRVIKKRNDGEKGYIETLLFPNAKTVGLERMIVLAVKGSGSPTVDFCLLAQPSIKEKERGDPGAKKALGSPLGLLLDSSMNGQGTKRGMSTQEVEEISMGIMSWHVLPTPRPQPKK